MTTATATKKKGGVLAELEQLEAAWADAERHARAASVEHNKTLTNARELADQRQRAAHRDPTLVNHRGEPAESGNSIAKLDAQLGELGDLEELAARARHAGEVAAKSKADTLAFIGPRFEDIVEALQPEAEARRDAVHVAATALADAAEGYLGFAQRVDALRASDRRLARTRVPAIEAGSALVRQARRDRDGDLPLATELR